LGNRHSGVHHWPVRHAPPLIVKMRDGPSKYIEDMFVLKILLVLQAVVDPRPFQLVRCPGLRFDASFYKGHIGVHRTVATRKRSKN
jgi:hypothetical protein